MRKRAAACVTTLHAGYPEAMEIVVLILLILGFVCFLVAALAPAGMPARPGLVPLGLAAWILTAVIGAAQSVGA